MNADCPEPLRGGCPSREQLAAFSCGRLPAAAIERVASHLEGCSACRSALAFLDVQSDSLIEALRSRPTEEPRQREEDQFVVSLVDALVGEHDDEPAAEAATAAVVRGELQRLRDYVLLEKLGEGGMGTVYKAMHSRLKKYVAIKVLPTGRLASPEAVARFLREMQVAGRLNHPNVVSALDAGEAGGIYYLAMELVEGVDLSALVARCGRLAVPDACEIVRQAALGLEAAHRQELVHRDVKPSN